MNDGDFGDLVAEGIDALPDKYGAIMDNVVIVISDAPTPEQREKLQLRPYTYLFGLYEGVPKTKRTNYGTHLPDKITIFKNDILRACDYDFERIREQVLKTVWHEVAHHFGLDDRDIRKRGA